MVVDIVNNYRIMVYRCNAVSIKRFHVVAIRPYCVAILCERRTGMSCLDDEIYRLSAEKEMSTKKYNIQNK